SDGTAAGTTLIQEFAAPLNLENLANVNGELFFEVFNPTSGGAITAQLWKSDGTSAGTQLVQDFTGQGTFGSWIGVLNQFYFTLRDSTLAGSLWVSDGTSTHQVDPGAFVNPFNLTPFNGQLYFMAIDPNFRGGELWKTDGTD